MDPRTRSGTNDRTNDKKEETAVRMILLPRVPSYVLTVTASFADINRVDLYVVYGVRKYTGPARFAGCHALSTIENYEYLVQ